MGAVLSELLQGNRRHFDPEQESFSKGDLLRKKLVLEGQHPKAVILTCSDSRACPETLFESEPGELFVIRVAGNVLSSEVLASMEYAVEHLETPLILILGHTQCGAIENARQYFQSENQHPSPHLNKLLSNICSHFDEHITGQDLEFSIKMHIEGVLKDLQLQSELLSEAIKEDRVELIGAIHHLISGKVQLL
jgi:carbonic anhydrase